MAYRMGKLLFLCGLLLLLAALWKKVELPAPQALRTDLLAEPRQSAVTKAPFHVSVGKIDYLVQPLFKYDLYGMVVSRHDSDTWWDYIHKDWNDRLNVAIGLSESARCPDLKGIGAKLARELIFESLTELQAYLYLDYRHEGIPKEYPARMPYINKNPICLSKNEILSVIAFLQQMSGEPISVSPAELDLPRATPAPVKAADAGALAMAQAR